MNKKGFTLVELIVVITILAILWTIAFISLQWYSKDARDSVRLTTVNTISRALELNYMQTWKYQNPDNWVFYSWWLTQWIIWYNNSRDLKLNEVPNDPLDNSNYIYSTFWNTNNYYQIWVNYENSSIWFISQAIANDEKKYLIRWNYKFDPVLPSLLVVENESLINNWIYDPWVCFVLDWWKNTFNECIETKSEMSFKKFDSSLVGYWDMETLTLDWKLKDLSGNENHWEFSYNMDYESSLTWSYLNKWIFFNGYHGEYNTEGEKQFIKINDSDTLKNFDHEITIQTLSYSPYNNTWWKFIFHRYQSSWTGTYSYWNYKTTSWIWWPYIATSDYNIRTPNIKGMNYWWEYISITTTYDWNNVKIFKNWELFWERYYDVKKNILNYDWANFIWAWCLDLNCNNNWNTSSYWLYWIIDEVKVYNRVLSPEEIAFESEILWF